MRTWVSTALSFGIPGAFSLLIIGKYLINKQLKYRREVLIYFIGTIQFIILSIFSIFAAYTDGRFIWAASIFNIIIIGLYYKDYGNKKHISKAGE